MNAERLRLLLIEDNLALASAIVDMLQAQGHQVDFAADGELGLRMALANPPDVVLLDLGLPGIDGTTVCRRLRDGCDRHVPVLMLTARDALVDKLQGFAAGADDYLIKPFDDAELLARCLALARRHRLNQPHRLQIGPLCIDRRTGQAWRDGVALEMPQLAQRILLELAEAWPCTVTRSELVQRLWGDEAPPSDPLRSHLYLLRQVLDRPFDSEMLRTVHGVGFRLEASP
ncbi:DNA-binding response regulator [Stenotrophomonas maltophilia]|uniref:response regulator transcription factor n=1 Tax=Stenotrophomonas maltophilia TaxID=40324 RepID=UPI0002C53EA2|nr:response regulator transcription factor [Stenotrophomonas maltophilia]MBA0396978.1 DNA-binding response regulator [Stenotrophomonas maltophilia]PJL09389.1 DNA-binding response regulator [Stenotrophomonas maltophilia]PJL43585.1 DNA-binding response regulator [Stenotrophomonas maltophilia]QGL74701.1 response regulator transcription factor [Stenotrophomonas maltophilia]CCP14743.1 Transcriptional regulatory protein yycF [Stenotrophomonas maltophilia RA8]